MVIKFSQVARWWPPPTACPGAGRFARLCAWYLLLNLLLCGAVVLPGVQSRNLSVSLPLSPGRLLAQLCGGVCRTAGPAVLCLDARSGAACRRAASGRGGCAGAGLPRHRLYPARAAERAAVVLLHYPPLRSRLPAAAAGNLDGWFAPAQPRPAGLGGASGALPQHPPARCMLPALPAALQLGKEPRRRAAGGVLLPHAPLPAHGRCCCGGRQLEDYYRGRTAHVPKPCGSSGTASPSRGCAFCGGEPFGRHPTLLHLFTRVLPFAEKKPFRWNYCMAAVTGQTPAMRSSCTICGWWRPCPLSYI